MLLLHERDRNERLALVNLFTALLGNLGRAKPEGLAALLEEYRAELTQERYHPTIAGIAYRKAKKKRRETLKDDQRLKNIDKFTVEDADLPPEPKGARRRR